MTTNDKLNKLLKSERIPVLDFKELRQISDWMPNDIDSDRFEKVIKWFRMLQTHEIKGWRPKPVTRNILKILLANSDDHRLNFYALFCPSYIKGIGAYGLRTDDVGNTTLSGIKQLDFFYKQSKEIGFNVGAPLAIYFDLALEQFDLISSNPNWQDSLDKNISNLKKYLPSHFIFKRVSEFGDLINEVGYQGDGGEHLNIPAEIFDRIVERGRKFYELFGWSEQKINKRSITIANSESKVGECLRKELPDSIMVYTPTMLERAAVYSGFNFETNPLPIIIPNKGL